MCAEISKLEGRMQMDDHEFEFPEGSKNFLRYAQIHFNFCLQSINILSRCFLRWKNTWAYPGMGLRDIKIIKEDGRARTKPQGPLFIVLD